MSSKCQIANCGYPPSFCDLGVHISYHKFIKKLRNFRRMENYKKLKREGYTYPYINEMQIRQRFWHNHPDNEHEN